MRFTLTGAEIEELVLQRADARLATLLPICSVLAVAAKQLPYTSLEAAPAGFPSDGPISTY